MQRLRQMASNCPPKQTRFFRRSLSVARRGTVALEFGLAAIPLLMLIIGVVEVSWQLTTAAALDEAVLRASRFGITGQATRSGEPPDMVCRSQTIPWIITSSTGGFLKLDHLNVSTEAYAGASGVGGVNGVVGAGSGGQVVTYVVTYEQPFLTGAWVNLFGGPSSITHRATIVVKNEPFDNATC